MAMIRTFLRFLLSAVGGLWLSTGAAEVAELSVDQAVALALQHYPALSEQQVRVQALEQTVVQQTSLPDPRLSLGLTNVPVNSLSLSEEPMTMMEIGLSQPLPYPGKRGLLQGQARAMQEAGVQELSEARLQVASEVRQTWWARYGVDRAREILTYNQELLRQIVGIAQTKYKVGQGLQQDVLLAQLELSKLLERDLMLKREALALQYRLNRLIGQAPEAELWLPGKTDTVLPNLRPVAQLVEAAMAARPQLRAQQARVRASEKGVELARRDYYPDFEVGASYGQRSGYDDMVSVMFSMNLPIYTARKQDPMLAQRNSEVLGERYRLEDIQAQIAARVRELVARYDEARARVALLKTGILPQARQTVDSMLAGYQVGKVDFLALTGAEVTQFDYETQYWQTYSEAQQTLAALQAEVGEESIHE
ncbi:MAG: TolC family protein [Pseudomonadota bacterium]